MSLQNPWIGYITRSYQQIKADVLTKFQAQVPEMTDHTETNIFVKMIGIWGGITEMLGYYVDNKGKDAFLPTTQLFSNAVKLARYLDYRIKSVVDASVSITFLASAPAPANIIIPAGTEVATAEEISFFTEQPVTILAGTTMAIASARQRVTVSNVDLGISNGGMNQKYVIGDAVVDAATTVKVNGVSWSFQPSLSLSNFSATHFTTNVNEDGDTYIEFGDGQNGKIPPVGAAITASYFTSSGAAANVAERKINNIISTLTLPTGVTVTAFNTFRAAGGADAEGLEALRVKIPLSIRTMDRAVTYEDYGRVAVQAGGVSKSAVYFECGKTVDVYIAPNGGGTASASLLSSVLNFFEDKRMVTTKVRVLPAGEIRVLFEILVNVLPNYVNSEVVARVKDNLSTFMNVPIQNIKGSVALGDIYQIVENTEGVKNSEVRKMTVLPFASPVSGTSTALNWDRSILPGSSGTQLWSIKIISATQYQLFKGSTFLGNFNIGTYYNFTEIRLRVKSGSYAISDNWEFYTYNYFGSFELKEFSVPLSYPENMVVYATGGI